MHENLPPSSEAVGQMLRCETGPGQLNMTQLHSFSEVAIDTVLCSAENVAGITGLENLQLRCYVAWAIDQKESDLTLVLEDATPDPQWKKLGKAMLSAFGRSPKPMRTLVVCTKQRFSEYMDGAPLVRHRIVPGQWIQSEASPHINEDQNLDGKIPAEFRVGLDNDGTILCRRVDSTDDPDNELWVFTHTA